MGLTVNLYRSLKQFLQRRFGSRERALSGTADELEQRVQHLEAKLSDLEGARDRLSTRFENTVAEAIETDTVESNNVASEAAGLVLAYRDYTKQYQYVKSCLEKYRDVLRLWDSDEVDVTVEQIEQLKSRGEYFDRKQREYDTVGQPDDMPHRTQTTYFFSNRTERWSSEEWTNAKAVVQSVLATVQQDREPPSLEEVTIQMFDEEFLEGGDNLDDSRAPSKLGDCPECGAALFSTDSLVEYESSAKETAHWVDCPDCGSLINPDTDGEVDLVQQADSTEVV